MTIPIFRPKYIWLAGLLRHTDPWDCLNCVRRWPSFVYPRNMTPEGLGIRAEITAEPLDPVDNEAAAPPGSRFAPDADISPQWVPGRDTPGRIPALRKIRARDPRCPRIYLHIGEPKTGTTFLQDAMWVTAVAVLPRDPAARL